MSPTPEALKQTESGVPVILPLPTLLKEAGNDAAGGLARFLWQDATKQGLSPLAAQLTQEVVQGPADVTGEGERAKTSDDERASVVPRRSPAVSACSRSGTAASAVERFTFPVLPEPGEDGPSPKAPLVIWPECGVTETVRACAEAAHNILRQLSLERTQVVAFSSPSDGDGKTSLVTALAPELAKRAAGSILAIDANLRKPDLTTMLRGTANSLAGRRAMIYPTNLPRLSVLPAPAVQGSQARRLDPALDDELRQGWSLVLLDTPSLAHAEAASMAACCDGVYLVVRLGHTARRAVAEAARLIRASGGRLLGCVVVG